MTENAMRAAVLACNECTAGVESCAFCDREECGEAICYKCLRIALAEAIAQPHTHGG